MLSISELVKGAITEAEAFGKQGTGSTDVPASVQLGRAAQASIQVKPWCLPCLHNPVPVLSPCPLSFYVMLLQSACTVKTVMLAMTSEILPSRLNSCVQACYFTEAVHLLDACRLVSWWLMRYRTSSCFSPSKM